MGISEIYRRQVTLLLRTIPLIATETCFALKGGTAINLFLRDMPRLSVDIDLTFLPVGDRATSLREIDSAMRRLADRIKSAIRDVRLNLSALRAENCITKIVVFSAGVQIKIEVTPVLRGCVYEATTKPVSKRVEEQFGFAEIQVVSFADLYAGKIVAALDRQHPRDLFDIRNLLNVEGITDELRKAFIVYLLSHNRPMAEILAPQRRDIAAEFARGFEGMTEHPVAFEDLLRAREDLIGKIVGEMPSEHRKFLMSVKRGQPDWALLDLAGVQELPAVRWRLQNLANLSATKRADLLRGLGEALEIAGR